MTLISLADYPLPLYDADLEAKSGPPANAINLKRLFGLHQGVFIASPEYNASITPLLKNTLDWVSRVREGREPPLAAYRNRAFALGAASNGTLGGMRSLIALRQVLELGCGPGHFWRDTRDLRPAGWRVVCSDLSPGMVAEARAALAGEAGLSFAAADAQALPLADASFEVVMANFMLYHVPDRPRALAEICRVLRPGG